VRPRTSRGKALTSLAFLLGFALGDLPREVGYRLDPYDSYREQFDTILVRTGSGPREGQIDLAKTKELAREHSRILAQECLPRLITGHRIVGPNLPWEPTSEKFGIEISRPETSPSITSVSTVLITSALFVLSTLFLMGKTVGRMDPASRATALVIVLTAAIVTAGFVINKNIYNSDNYRYLVFWLVAWAAGFGLFMDGLWQRGSGGRVLSGLLSLSLAATMTLDTISWYQSLGWVVGLRPTMVESRDPAYAWLAEHPEIRGIFGDYWDVYRLQFLLGSRVQGLPYPIYPDRYNAAQTLPARRPRHLIGRTGQFGPFYMERARLEGGTVLYQAKDLTIIDWPVGP
jgi:hypothetical protein